MFAKHWQPYSQLLKWCLGVGIADKVLWMKKNPALRKKISKTLGTVLNFSIFLTEKEISNSSELGSGQAKYEGKLSGIIWVIKVYLKYH